MIGILYEMVEALFVFVQQLRTNLDKSSRSDANNKSLTFLVFGVFCFIFAIFLFSRFLMTVVQFEFDFLLKHNSILGTLLILCQIGDV